MRRRSEQHSRQVLVEVARETGNDLPSTKTRPAGDPKSLRGIPVTGVPGGIGGTMADTNPLAVVLKKEAQAERRASKIGADDTARAERGRVSDTHGRLDDHSSETGELPIT